MLYNSSRKSALKDMSSVDHRQDSSGFPCMDDIQFWEENSKAVSRPTVRIDIIMKDGNSARGNLPIPLCHILWDQMSCNMLLQKFLH